jgi:Uma2 family endonuclease
MTEQLPLNTSPLPVRLRIEDYLLLDASGAFERYGKTELIDGELVFVNAQHRPHARIKSRLYRLIADALDRIGAGAEAVVEGSVGIPPANVPEPDIVVTDQPEGEGLIPLDSVRLIVEVADATLETDLNRKASVYARHGIVEYWVVDVKGRLIHQLWQPQGQEYAGRRQVEFGGRIEAVTMAGLALDTTALG